MKSWISAVVVMFAGAMANAAAPGVEFEYQIESAATAAKQGIRLVASTPEAQSRPCGVHARCFYDAEQRLVYWTREYDESYDPPRKAYITGYAAVREKAQRHNELIRTLGVDFAKYSVPVTGSVNLRTLSIPSLASRAQLESLWTRFIDACSRASGEKEFDGCTVTQDDFIKTTVTEGRDPFQYPNADVHAGAMMFSLMESLARNFDLTIVSLQPAADRWRAIKDPDWILRGDYFDHIEPDQIPPATAQKAADFEKALEKNLRETRGEIRYLEGSIR